MRNLKMCRISTLLFVVVTGQHALSSAFVASPCCLTGRTASFRYPPSFVTSSGAMTHRPKSQTRNLFMSATASNDVPKGQSLLSSSFNLIKAIVGSGVLALPSGVAVMSDAPVAVIPSSLFIIFLGSLSAYSFYVLGRLSHLNGAGSLGEMWDQEIGKDTSWIVSLSTFTFAMGAALAYSIVLGDTFGGLARTMGLKGFLASRHASILAVTAMALMPLSSLPSLASLAPMSIVGVVGVFVTCLFMAVRCFDPSSPYALPSGSLLATLAPELTPSFGSMGLRRMLSPSALILVATSACSFLAHFSAPDFYKSLTQDDTALSKFRLLTMLGFGSVALINVAILTFGFLTFGGNSSGIILNNYSTLDLGASICRLLMAISVMGGFPFLIAASKSAFFKLRPPAGNVSKADDLKVTRSLVAIVTGLALLMENAGFVVSFNGAIMGSAIIYIFPSMLFLQSAKRRLQSGTLRMSKGLKTEQLASRFLIGFGLITGLAGGAVTILNTYCPQVLR